MTKIEHGNVLHGQRIRSNMMYKRIFVPVDNSDTSNLALDEAIRLAKDEGATLILAHIVARPSYSIHNREELEHTSTVESEMQIGQAIMKTAMQRAHLAGLKPEEIVREAAGESIASAILEAAEASQAELIVMGTHGRTGLMHMLVGSVAEGLLRKSRLPILMIRRS
jgi:nucleotide-binding universal stress UspA family protein